MGRLVEPVPSMKTKIKSYFDLAEEIHKYFGYKEDWVCIPMDNRIDDYWMIINEDSGGGRVAYGPGPLTKEIVESGTDIYGGSIYTQRFLKQWVYRTKDLTMACVNIHTDGNKFLMIFDNNKECKDDYLKKLYMEKWASPL